MAVDEDTVGRFTWVVASINVRHNAIERSWRRRAYCYRTSEQDARVVQMSLTDMTYKQMAQLASQQQALNELVFAEFGGNVFRDITQKLTELSERLEKACLKATAGL